MKNITTKTKILIPMFILTFILIFIGGTVTFFNYSKISSLQELNKNIELTSKISAILHSLQRERGLSCGYVVSKNNRFKNDLLMQRELSDESIKKFNIFLYSSFSTKFSNELKILLKEFSILNKVRNNIDLYDIEYDNIITYYSHINSTFLDILIKISKNSHIPKITQNILAYSHFLYFKEYMGIERAEGVTIYSKQKVDRVSLIRFSNILSLENRSREMFLKYASKTIKDYYYNSSKNASFSAVKKMQKIIQYKQDIKDENIDAEKWFKTITQSLDILDLVANFVEKETLKNIKIELQELQNIFIILTLLIVISFIVFILMLIAFFRLAREEQRLRIVTDKYIISSTTDLTGKIIDVSAAFCTISGYTREDLIGKPHNIIRHSDMPKEAFKTMWNRLARGLPWSGKVKNRRKGGGFYWVYANVEPLFASNGKIDSYISIRLDITESELLSLKIKEEERKNKFQEDMMKEQSRLVQMGEMISMIAHQWRQPLSAIAAASGSLEIKAKRGTLKNETTLEIANKIKGFSLHLSSTIDDFRNFFKTNKQETLTNFETILNGVLTIIEGSLNENNIKLTTEIIEPQEFKSYEGELKQVILNLIKNAEDVLIENSIIKPEIHVIIKDNTFTIQDNAGGIKEEIIDKIFNPYFSTKTKKDGTGLGLYMSKMIIEDHCKGKLLVTNEKLGAKFEIILGENNA